MASDSDEVASIIFFIEKAMDFQDLRKFYMNV